MDDPPSKRRAAVTPATQRPRCGAFPATPITVGAAMFVLSVAAFAIRAVSFGLFMMALTPLVVLKTGAPDTHEWMIAVARAAITPRPAV